MCQRNKSQSTDKNEEEAPALMPELTLARHSRIIWLRGTPGGGRQIARTMAKSWKGTRGKESLHAASFPLRLPYRTFDKQYCARVLLRAEKREKRGLFPPPPPPRRLEITPSRSVLARKLRLSGASRASRASIVIVNAKWSTKPRAQDLLAARRATRLSLFANLDNFFICV